MRILSAEQHRSLDRATMKGHGISSLELMERAASAWTATFITRWPDKSRDVVVVAGSGNNGGDGLVIARKLQEAGYRISVVHARVGAPSPDNTTNRARLDERDIDVLTIAAGDALPSFPKDGIVVDALFGTGLSRPITGYWAKLVNHLNEQSLCRIAVDLPSGLFADSPPEGSIVRADYTLSLGYPKFALFAPTSAPYVGQWRLVDFVLADRFVAGLDRIPATYMLNAANVAPLLKSRSASDHKGTFGHALVVAGAYRKMGAAVICARSVLRAGAGLVTTHLPRTGYEIMQISFPEAMCSVDRHRYHFTGVDDVGKYDTIAVGPGIGQEATTGRALFEMLQTCNRPIVVDADALNLLAATPAKLELLPRGSILTPHPREFERLFGETDNDFARWELLRDKSRELGCVVLLKTNHTAIATPAGELYFNTTGNPGMGTGGTGDALTGILTGLLAQGYAPEEAARLGVYLHGLAGDIAVRRTGQEALLAEDVVGHLGRAFRRLRAGAQAL